LNNAASFSGWDIAFFAECLIYISGTSIIKFSNNIRRFFGGAIYATENTNVSFSSNATITFYSSKATSGGAMYLHG